MSDEFTWPTRDEEDAQTSTPTLAESQRALERTGSVTPPPPPPSGPAFPPPPYESEPTSPEWFERPESGGAGPWIARVVKLGVAVVVGLIAIGIFVGDEEPTQVTDRAPVVLPNRALDEGVPLAELDPDVAEAAPRAVLAVAQLAADAGVPLPEDAFGHLTQAVDVVVAQGATPGERMMSYPGAAFRRAMDFHRAQSVAAVPDWYSLPLPDALRAAELVVETAPFCSAQEPYSCEAAREGVTKLVALMDGHDVPASVDLGPSFEEGLLTDDWGDAATLERFFALLAEAGVEIDPELADLMRAVRTPAGYAALPADFDEDRVERQRELLNELLDPATESPIDAATFELVLAHAGAIRSAQDCRWRELSFPDCVDLRADRYFAHRIVTDIIDAG